MNSREAIAAMQGWLDYLDRQQERAHKMARLAALAKTGPEGHREALRQKGLMDSSPRVYDGANLEPAVRYAIKALKGTD